MTMAPMLSDEVSGPDFQHSPMTPVTAREATSATTLLNIIFAMFGGSTGVCKGAREIDDVLCNFRNGVVDCLLSL